jgi:hypothetical protein
MWMAATKPRPDRASARGSGARKLKLQPNLNARTPGLYDSFGQSQERPQKLEAGGKATLCFEEGQKNFGSSVTSKTAG